MAQASAPPGPKNPQAAARNSHRARPGRKLRELLDLQDVALSLAKSTSTEDKVRAQAMRAWHDFQRLLMDLQGIGKPKPVPAKNEPKVRTRKGAQPVE